LNTSLQSNYSTTQIIRQEIPRHSRGTLSGLTVREYG
jgi:hypothetical protein